MKAFIRTFFVVIGVFFTVLIIGIVALAIQQKDSTENQLPDEMVLHLRIEDTLTEVAKPSSLLNPFEQTPLTVRQIVQSIDRASYDDRVKGLVIDMKSGEYGLAQLQEIRAAVAHFRTEGKLTLLFADTMGDGPAMGSYYFASAFEQVWMQPIGELAITGIGIEMPFGHDLLQKVGVEPQILHRGRYKSYPESLMRNSMSDDNREMTTGLLNDLYGQMTETMAQARGLSKDQLQTLIDHAPLSADQALVGGLIDAEAYHDDIDFYLEQTLPDAETLDMADYADYWQRVAQPKKHRALIGYVTIEGTLMDVDAEDGMFGSGVASAGDIADAIDEAADHPHLRALVIRVNSPGGSPIAAEIIRRSILNASARMPVVVSMSDAAASGGYWLSTAATKIVAQPATLTGSIGVFGGKIALNGLWDKLGVNWQEIKIGNQAGIWSPNRLYTDSEQHAVEQSLDRIYNNFIKRVAEGRHMPEDTVRAIAEGRVWTGRQGLANGLVDALGGLETAVDIARDQAQLKPDARIHLISFPEEKSPVAQLLKMAKRRLGSSDAQMAKTTALTQLSAITGVPLGELQPMLYPQTYSTYSYVRVH